LHGSFTENYNFKNLPVSITEVNQKSAIKYLALTMQKKKTLVLGASDNPSRYSYLAIQQLRNHDHPVVAIGRKHTLVDDVQITTSQELFENIDTITVYLNPVHQQEYYAYILSLHPKRIIFNPGAENAELAGLTRQNNIETLEACTLVMLSTNQF